ncbi:hypothetical protein, partial [Novipirellula sp.]|uniref:hypothetical protein n=1 Tax=Novipirellula sp. TaxID=2795430 RepID=UPI0035632DB4
AGSIGYSRQLARLRHTHAELRAQVGLLEVEDPTKVGIASVSYLQEDIPPGVDQAYVWQYRIHIPANYGPRYKTQRGLVTADSPRGRGSSGGSYSGSNSQAEEVLLTIALIHADGKWMFCRTTGGSSSTATMPDEFAIDALEDLVIDVPVTPEQATRTFEIDEAICLFRLREKSLAKKRNGEPEVDLYQGLAVYLYSDEHSDAFDAWARGKAESMQEAMP